MIKSDFELIMDSINDRIAGCSEHLDRVHTTDDIKQLTIQQAINLKQFCVDEEPIMTKIAMVDLYHIIGMGNMTPIQMSSFIYKVKDYLEYRPRIKAIAKNLDSIFTLPKLPVSTQFRLLGLCDMTLATDFDGEVDDACIDDYELVKGCRGAKVQVDYSDELPFKLEGKTITVDLSRSAKFAKVLTGIFKCPMSESNFLNKVQLKAQYGGIDWISEENGIATGKVVAENNFRKLESYFRNYTSYTDKDKKEEN